MTFRILYTRGSQPGVLMQLPWLPLRHRIKHSPSCKMFKIVKMDAPPNLIESFQSISMVHDHTTKQSINGDLFRNSMVGKYNGHSPTVLSKINELPQPSNDELPLKS